MYYIDFANVDCDVMHMLTYTAGSLEQCGRMMMIRMHDGKWSQAKTYDRGLPFAVQKCERRTYCFELYHSGQTDDSKYSEPVGFSS